MNLVIKCSPEQIDVIGDHYLDGSELGVLPDERHWMLAQARKIQPSCRILSAELDAPNGTWILQISV
jgi:hypothetical protein